MKKYWIRMKYKITRIEIILLVIILIFAILFTVFDLSPFEMTVEQSFSQLDRKINYIFGFVLITNAFIIYLLLKSKYKN